MKKIRNIVFMGMVSERALRKKREITRDESREMATDIMAAFTTKLTHPIRLARSFRSSLKGEPLNNFDNVKAAVTAMVSTKQFGLAFGHVTVSTVGVTPKIKKLTAEMPFVNLALSLHAPNQEMRSEIVPAAKAYKIEGLIEALDQHMKTPLRAGGGAVESTNKKKVRKAMIQYTMLDGPTATFECAHQLGKLCEGKNIIVNLIPYNTTDVKDKFKCPPHEHIVNFQKIVMSYGLYVFIRKTMGQDIAGACGQLVLQNKKEGGVDVENAAGTSNCGVKRTVGSRKLLNPKKTNKKNIMQGARDDTAVLSAFAFALGVSFVMLALVRAKSFTRQK